MPASGTKIVDGHAPIDRPLFDVPAVADHPDGSNPLSIACWNVIGAISWPSMS